MKHYVHWIVQSTISTIYPQKPFFNQLRYFILGFSSLSENQVNKNLYHELKFRERMEFYWKHTHEHTHEHTLLCRQQARRRNIERTHSWSKHDLKVSSSPYFITDFSTKKTRTEVEIDIRFLRFVSNIQMGSATEILPRSLYANSIWNAKVSTRASNLQSWRQTVSIRLVVRCSFCSQYWLRRPLQAVTRLKHGKIYSVV